MNDQKLKSWFGKHKIVTGVIVVLLLIGIGGAIDQSNPTVTNKPVSSGSSNTSPSSTSNQSQPTNSQSLAHVGGTLSLKDQDGNPADITLVKIVDPATGGDEYTNPDNGKRFVGVQIKITNTGTKAISQEADNNVTLLDSSSQSYNSDVSSLGNCPEFADSGNIAPGESVLGCVAFQVPTGATISKVQYTPSSGYADETGEWLAP